LWGFGSANPRFPGVLAALHPWLFSDTPSGLHGVVTPTGSPGIARGDGSAERLVPHAEPLAPAERARTPQSVTRSPGHRARNRRYDWYRLHAARNPHHDTPDEMTPHDALYAAICAQPDEDTPRLAFADLLDEDGDAARAAFIRTQVQLARVPEYDPLWVKCRQFDFNAISGWAVAHTLPDLPAGYKWHQFEFRRGFPWKIGVRSLDAFVEGGAAVFDVAPIQALEIDASDRPDLAVLADWPHLAKLRRLEFSLGRFDPDAAAQLRDSAYSGHLRELTFESNAITPSSSTHARSCWRPRGCWSSRPTRSASAWRRGSASVTRFATCRRLPCRGISSAIRAFTAALR